MLFSSENSVLLVIDIQGKLASLIFEKEKTYKNVQALIQAAQFLKMPIILTEQVPEKIGDTIPEISSLLKDVPPIEKVTFSCYPNKRFQEALKKSGRKEVIVVGIETHVCVVQTVADLLREEYLVQVVADAVSSRSKDNKEIALERMRNLGATLTSTEMIMCELLKTSEHPKFKDVLNLIK